MNPPTEQITATYKGSTDVPPYFIDKQYNLSIRRMNYPSGMRIQIIRANGLNTFTEYTSEAAFWRDWEKA
jgi:hypothetical protein